MRGGTDALAKAEHLDPVFLLNFHPPIALSSPRRL